MTASFCHSLRGHVVLGLVCLFALAAPGPAVAQAPSYDLPDVEDRGPALSVARSSGFLDGQLRYPRVREAFQRKGEWVDAVLEHRGVEDLGEVFFRVFKREQELEVWAREPAADAFTLVRTYPVCEISGRLGPKRQQGDRQIPEGFYSIDLFNPSSQYHLSMRVDYPNRVDRARGRTGSLGGDIYIHGGCATIGCVPVTDDYIEELYLIAAGARDAGQRRIPVHIFPTRLDDDGLRWLTDTFGADYVDYPFWQNLEEGYRAFEELRDVPTIRYDGTRYTFSAPSPAPGGGSPAEPTGLLGTPISESEAGIGAELD